MHKTTIQVELPPELTARARSFVEDGWASDFNELLAEALRRFLESHSAGVTEAFVMSELAVTSFAPWNGGETSLPQVFYEHV